MSPITHLFASWVIAAKTTDNVRDRRLVALSGIAPDLDGAGIIVDFVRQARHLSDDFWYFQKYHHHLLHGIFGAVAIALILALFAQSRGRVFLLCLLAVHGHFLCDLLGSRGPEAHDLWPIHYLAPLSYHWTWVWKHQWALDAWPNRLITLWLFAWILLLALRLGDSPVGVFNRKADSVFIGVLRGWFCRAISTVAHGP